MIELERYDVAYEVSRQLKPQDIQFIKQVKRDDVVALTHFSLGLYIRNKYCRKEISPDDVSGDIVLKVWDLVNGY